jgi:HAD superfamily hydrolase (TIGR01549 family)
MAVAVLFDLEDTLVQTPWANRQHVLEFRRKTKEKLIEIGIPPSLLEGIERATIMRNKSIEYVEKNFTKTEAQKFYLEMEKFLSKYELDSAKKSKLFPETIQTLKTLRTLGARIGLVTNTSIKAVNIVFQTHRLKHYFDVVVTRENVKKLKPDPEGVLLAVKKLNVKNFFIVGDLVHDVIAARSANGSSILVKTNSEEKMNFEADHVVKSLNEIINIIQDEKRKCDDRHKEG